MGAVHGPAVVLAVGARGRRRKGMVYPGLQDRPEARRRRQEGDDEPERGVRSIQGLEAFAIPRRLATRALGVFPGIQVDVVDLGRTDPSHSVGSRSPSSSAGRRRSRAAGSTFGDEVHVSPGRTVPPSSTLSYAEEAASPEIADLHPSRALVDEAHVPVACREAHRRARRRRSRRHVERLLSLRRVE